MSLVDKIQNTSTSLFVLIGLAIGGLMYWNDMDAIEAKDRQIESKKNEVQLAEEAIQETKKIASDKSKFEIESNQVAALLKAAVEFLPNKLNEQDVLQKISDEARSAGVNTTNIKPKKSQLKGFYEELQMDVEMEGSYQQLVQFLAYISKIQRIVNIRGLELKMKKFEDETPLLSMKGTLVAYRYVEGTPAIATPAPPNKGGKK